MKKLMLVPLFIAATAASSIAFAGAKWGYPVVVSSTTIVGSLGMTRASGSTKDYVEFMDSGTSITVRALQASTGATASCVTSDPALMTQFRAANSDASVYISFSAGKCLSATIMNSSAQAPKVM